MTSKIERLIASHDFKERDEIEAYLNEVLAEKSIDELVPDTPADEALALIAEAEGSDDDSERLRLARRALEIDPACADAYRMLASVESDPSRAAALLEEGLQIASDSLGTQVFTEGTGHFWSLSKTRPYMRVREELAHTLWAQGQHEQAVAHAQDLLHLDENDHVGMRYNLVNWLLELGHVTEAGELIDRFDQDLSSMWLYSKALSRFASEGGSELANQHLAQAYDSNPYVVEVFFVENDLDMMADANEVTARDEAMVYASMSVKAWIATEGAYEWFADQARQLILHKTNGQA